MLKWNWRQFRISRELSGFTLDQMALALGVSTFSICKWSTTPLLSGVAPRCYNLAKIVKFFKVDDAYFWADVDSDEAFLTSEELFLLKKHGVLILKGDYRGFKRAT